MPPEDLYFVAIGGTAMAPLAALLSRRGHRVTGSDSVLYPPMSELLARESIAVSPGYAAENVPVRCDRVVIGNAVPRSNPEVEEVIRRGLPYVSLPEAIALYLLPGRHSVVVSGTHGKTTTAALLAWILTACGRDPSFLVGGEIRNFGEGFRDGSGPDVVLEGDEYNAAFFDRGPKFLHYRARTLLLNNIEFDHADLYGDLASVKDAFRRLVDRVPTDGVIVANADDANVREVLSDARARVLPVGLSLGAEISAREETWDGRGTAFRLTERGGDLTRMEVPLWGAHNLRNTLMAVAAARVLNVRDEEIAAALPGFQGVRRRLEELGSFGGVLYVDDFAHHPTAVGETIAAARRRWSERRIWGVFEPRSITAGRKPFQEAYVRAFGVADAAVLAPVFHAGRFRAEELIDRNEIARVLASRGVEAYAPGSIEEVGTLLASRTRPGDVVVLMSSGDFSGLRAAARERAGA